MSEQNFKIWKASADSDAGFMVTPEYVVMAATDKNYVVVDEHGTSVAGPISFMTTSENIRQGGLFTQLPDFVKMIPGTMVTPIPQGFPFPPVALIASVAENLPALLALMV